MFCQNCGNELNEGAKFCPNCGAAVTGEPNDSEAAQNTVKTPVQVQLRCRHCNGTMTADENKEILTCPFCGSQELIIDSDAVAVEKIKSRAYKEVESQKLEHEKAKALHEEENKEIETYKKSKLAKWSIIFAVIFGIVCVTCFSNHCVITGIISAIQTLIFLASWLLGSRIFQSRKKGLHTLLFIAGMLLIIADIFTGSIYSHPAKKQESSEAYYYDDTYDDSKASTKSDSTTAPKSSEEKAEAATDTTKQPETESAAQETTSAGSNEIRPEFQAAMDSYESFMNEYCDFMERYAKSSDPTSMLVEYLDYLSRYTETAEKFDAIGDEEMSDAELGLYMDVSNRIAQRLIETGSSL